MVPEAVVTPTAAPEPVGAESHGNTDAGPEAPASGENKTLGEGSSQEAGEHRPEPGTEKQYSDQDKAQIEGFMKKLNLPPEITYFQDKDNQLKFIIPINGKKYVASPEDVFKGFGLNQAGYQKLNEGKDLVSNVRDYFNQMKQNPDLLWDLAGRLGLDSNQLAQARLEAQVAEASMTPEQRAIKQAQKERDEAVKKAKDYEMAEKQREMASLVAKEKERYDTELSAAMEKKGFKKLPPAGKSFVLERAVAKLNTAMKADRQLSCEDAVYLATQDLQDFVQGYFGEIDDNHIINLVPRPVVDAIRRADIKKIQGGDTAKEIPTFGGNEVKNLKMAGGKGKKAAKKTITEFFETLT
jgi:hypothetical protein